MHLLVPGAYRPKIRQDEDVYCSVSQCTFWCRVLTDYLDAWHVTTRRGSQCTFWCRVLTDWDMLCFINDFFMSQFTVMCRVLTDRRHGRGALALRSCLNAPSGAGCLPTVHGVAMMRGWGHSLNAPSGAGCLPTRGSDVSAGSFLRSQCTFWCRVLTDARDVLKSIATIPVSMHLLVPGAYRLVP